MAPKPAGKNDRRRKSTTPGSSSQAQKTPKKPLMTRKAKKANEYAAGRPDDLSSFLSTYKTETTCIRYLGYECVGDFRKLQLSFYVLEYFNVWSRYCTGAKSSATALELIRDVSDREPEARFPADLTVLVDRYGPAAALKNPQAAEKLQEQERESNLNYLMATLVFRLAERLQEPMTLSAQEQEQRQQAACKLFAELHPGLGQVAAFDTQTILPPKLGPFVHLEEHVLEKYNRAYNLLRSVARLTAPSNWALLQSDPFPNRIVHPTYTPRWMLATPKASSLRPSPTAFPKKKMLLVHEASKKTKYSAALLEHEQEHVEAQGLSMPPVAVLPARDPRAFDSGEQWRDTIRRQLSMQDLRVDLFTMALWVTAEDADWNETTTEKKKLNFYGESQNLVPWRDIKDLLLQSALEVRIQYTLRPLEEGEEFQYEFSGAPLALESDFRFDESGDIEQIPFPDIDDDNTEPQIDEAEEAKALAFLTGGGVASRKPPIPQSEFSAEDREKMLEQHDNYDVFTPEGLLAWQEMVIDKVAMKGPQAKARKEIPLRGDKTVSRELREVLREAQEEGEATALTTDSPEMMDDGRYYQIQAAFSGSQSNVGPYVEVSKTALAMETYGKFKGTDLDLSYCTALPGCKRTFLDAQITAAAFIIQRTYGGVPVSEARNKIPEVAVAVNALKSVKTSGGYLADVTGLGKTDEALLALSWCALYGDHRDGHRPHLVVTPNGTVFAQWAEKIWRDYRDVKLIISNDERPSDQMYQDCWVSSSAMREAPADLRNWPEHLRYIFDPKDERASKTIILTPYDSHMARTVGLRWVDKSSVERKEALALPDQSSKSRKKLRQEKKARAKELQRQEPIWVSRWKGIFEFAWLDEGHRVRHAITKTHASILLLESRVHWIITATIQINSSFDSLGGLHLLWPEVKRTLMASQEAMKWLQAQPETSFHLFKRLDEIPKTDVRNLIALDPERIRALLETRDVVQIATYFHYLDDQVTIRRSTASVLYRSEWGGPIEMRSMMPKHVVKTVELAYTDEEALEAQWFHRNNARLYMSEISKMLEGGDTILKKNLGPNATRRRLKNNFASVTAHSRRLTIGAKATKLARFDLVMQKLGQKTLVNDMEGYRAKGHTAEWIVEMTIQKGDPMPTTRLERIQFLAEGSPTLRYILRQIKEIGTIDPDVSKDRPTKLLITEDVPLIAWFWELCLNYLYIQTETLHSGLSYSQRVDLVHRFNAKKGPLRVVNLMYSVGAQGTNMDHDSYRVLVSTAALNASLEIQAWGRLIRISQPFEVLVTRCKVLNSHDQFRDSRQTDKAIMDMAGRADDPQIQALLVKLLNEANGEVAAAHASQKGLEYKASFQRNEDPATMTAFDLELEDGQRLAGRAADEMDVGGISPDRSGSWYESMRAMAGRVRHAPQRLIEESQYQNTLVKNSERKYIEMGFSSSSSSSQEDEDVDENYATGDDDNSTSGSGSGHGSELSDESDREGRNVEAISSEYITDPNGDIRLVSRATEAIRKTYRHLTKQEQEDYDQDTITLRQHLTLDPKKVYTVEDLKTTDVLDRSLRLLFRARFGQQHEYVRISPHIRYDKLSRGTVKAIDANAALKEQEVMRLRLIAAGASGTTSMQAGPSQMPDAAERREATGSKQRGKRAQSNEGKGSGKRTRGEKRQTVLT